MSLAAFFGLLFGTFVSEDLASVAAGLMIQRGDLSAAAGVTACAAGILLGDWGLWAIGRAGRRAAASAWARRRIPLDAGALRSRLATHAGTAIVASRFVPGTRAALYVTAGLVGVPWASFAVWTFAAVVVWTPIVVLSTAASGALGIAGLCAALVAVRLVQTRRVREMARRAVVRLQQWRRWEFWPMWLFYSPVAVWVALLAMRYRGVSTITAANPGISDGGVVGESKFAILTQLPADATIPAERIDAGGPADRVRAVMAHVRREGWQFPVVLKPDVGQRGVGVKLVPDESGVAEYLAKVSGPVVLQQYHEGPFEAGIFYYRMPGWERGRILSITDKQFPVVVGDGRSTLGALIRSHPRYRLQSRVFLERHRGAASRVVAEGERVQLAFAGNHAQGTMFCDGSHLLTPALERRIDDIARAFPGFHVGRFDVRYRDRDEFMAGRDLAIVELNGATAESTDIYDPRNSLLGAYRRLFCQWSIVFAIGWANRLAGAPVTSPRRLYRLVRTHLTTPVAFAVSD